jgi:hypothetical protein
VPYCSQGKEKVDGFWVCTRFKHRQKGDKYRVCVALVALQVQDLNDGRSEVSVIHCAGVRCSLLLALLSLEQAVYRVHVRPCLGRKVFQTYARPQWLQHVAANLEAREAFNKAIMGLEFNAAVNIWKRDDGSDPMIMCYDNDS